MVDLLSCPLSSIASALVTTSMTERDMAALLTKMRPSVLSRWTRPWIPSLADFVIKQQETCNNQSDEEKVGTANGDDVKR